MLERLRQGMWVSLAAAALAALTAGELRAQDDRLRGPLQVTTYNIHHGTGNVACTPPAPTRPPQPDCDFNLERVAETIRAFDSDVVALQEVDRFWARSAYTDQPARLGEALGMHACFGANLDHLPDSHSTVPHQYGTAILSRYPIVECTNTLLPRPTGEQRGLLQAVISAEGTLIRVYNTHLDTRIASRSQQTPAVVNLIGTPSEPVVLMGDLNARPHATEMVPVYAAFDDVWDIAGSGPGYTFPADIDREPDRRIDYIFVSRGNVEVLSTKVTVDDETRLTSDHAPLTAKVRFP